MNTLISIADAQPEATKSFRAFRNADAKTVKFCNSHTLVGSPRVVRYSAHPNDVRIVVNYVGRSAKHKPSTKPARIIMHEGMILTGTKLS